MSCFDTTLQSLIISEMDLLLSDPSMELAEKDLARLISLSPFFSGITSENLEPEALKDRTITESDMRIISGVSKLVAHANSDLQKPTVINLLKVLQMARYLNYEMFQGWENIPPNDVFSFELTDSLLHIASISTDLRDQICTTIWQVFIKVGEDLKQLSDEYICIKYIPFWLGLLRALGNNSFEWDSSLISQLEERARTISQTDFVDAADEKLDQLLASEGNDYAKAFFLKYNYGEVSSNNIIFRNLQVTLNFLVRKVNYDKVPKNSQTLSTSGCIKYLSNNPGTSAIELNEESRTALHGLCYMALEIFSSIETYFIEKEAGDTLKLEKGQLELFICSLRVATLSCVHLRELKEKLTIKLTDILMILYPKLEDADAVKLVTVTLECISILSINLPESHASLSNICCKFITTPISDNGRNLSEASLFEIREVSSSRLANSVKFNTETAISTIHFLVNHMFSINENCNSFSESGDRKLVLIESIISAIASIGQNAKNNDVSDLAVTMLCRQFATGTQATRAFILEKLSDIVLSVSDRSYEEILEIFSAISKAETSADSKTLMSTILKCYYSISYQIHSNIDKCDSFFRYMLALANEKGVHIQRSLKEKRKGVQITAISGELGILLPILSQILCTKDFSPHLNPDEELQGAFRNFWFHCVLYDFVSESTWVKEWRSSMLDIAAKSPILVPNSSGNYLDTDLEYNSVLRRAFSEQELLKMRNQLIQVLPSHSNEIRYLNFAQIIFLLSLYHIEIMRCNSGNFSFILNYFSNESVNVSKLAVLVEAIADDVSTKFLAESQNVGLGLILNNSVISQLQNVLVNCCHRVEKMVLVSLHCAKKFFDAFPQLIYHRRILYTALELLQLLWQGCEGEMQDEYCPVFEFTSELVGVTIQLPDSYNYRKQLLSQFSDSVNKWLHSGKNVAASEMDNHLQAYLYETATYETSTGIHYGRSLAMKYGRLLPQFHQSSNLINQLAASPPDNTSQFSGSSIMKSYFNGRVSSLEYGVNGKGAEEYLISLKVKLKELYGLSKTHTPISKNELKITLNEAAAWLVLQKDKVDYDLIRYVCWIPVYIFTTESIKLASSIWSWVSTERSDLEVRLMNEIQFCWIWTIVQKKGLFSIKLDTANPFVQKMEYTPTDPQVKSSKFKLVYNSINPHATWIKFFVTRYDAFTNTNPEILQIIARILLITFKNAKDTTTNPVAREPRFRLLLLGLKMLRKNNLDPIYETRFRSELYGFAFAWFMTPPRWNSSGNKQLCIDEFNMMARFKQSLDMDTEILNMNLLDLTKASSRENSSLSILFNDTNEFKSAKANDRFILDKSKEEIILQFQKSRRLLQLLTENELSRLRTLNHPVPTATDPMQSDGINNIEKFMTEDSWRMAIRLAWDINPKLALHLHDRFKQSVIETELQGLILKDPIKVTSYSEALNYFLSQRKIIDPLFHKWLLYWAPVPPISAASFLATIANDDPYILQYSMRVLHYHPVDVVFFYIPQTVQALRYDRLGYVEKFILDAARVSQLFAHQIIWNMKANFLRNETTGEPDVIKEKLEMIIEKIVHQLSGADKEFYNKEFEFFNKVTGISGILKPYIKKPKEEKKKKIDEEMKKIKVEVGVYLPSNPEGQVIDIDYKSGRPLQSHAKAPFMATFKIRKEVEIINETPEELEEEKEKEKAPLYKDVWQSAVFKVGDDCRQDVLALQLIAIFKNIYSNFGLDLYLFPYRIVATSPGCGVIDAIPNSISRDQLGREKVNDLNNYFLATYGGYNSIDYQKARNAYVQSVAAYSVVSYILQIKDRHNGNIMIDKDGHTIHIDFGFILEISPGGINFESSPFKLTTEMIQVMGGSSTSQPYRWFTELCIKAYLAIRPYANEIIQVVQLMLDSGLPCFKGENTIKNLRWRFQLDKSERAAADFMIARISESYGNKRTVLYDSFQFATNGIPH
ncbi:hypothetical protein K502DRAFT_301430 [Neoconidiobolus thromboides FSU 785]|nr:hypothetical protein K502DRAFT_301430 [Neoconidiobolus thromboides FSU 785]